MEVESAITCTRNNSAPSPEEKILSVFIKNGGENLLKCLHLLFQTCWERGTLCTAFKLDPKALLPKPGKDDYNTVRAYRPITLESVIGKIFSKNNSLQAKMEIRMSKTQDACRKQHSCVQSATRMINQL